MLGLGLNIAKKNRGGGGGGNPYQAWANYTDSPVGVESATYPYQLVNLSGSTPILFASTAKIYWTDRPTNAGTYVFCQWSSASQNWGAANGPSVGAGPFGSSNSFREANNDVYTSADYTTVAYAKTT